MATRSPLTVVLTAMALSTVSTFALFTAAAWTGSSALLAIAIQALIAAVSQGFLLHGLAKSSEKSHSDAYEMYFWSFGVAVLLFSLGAGIAMYDGVAKLADPLPNRYHHIAFTVLALTFVLTAAATYLALKHVSAPRPQAVARTGPRGAQEAAASTIVIEGMAGLLGIAIAAAGIVIAQSLSAPAADGYAAITVGLVLGVVAAFMSLEIRTLLVRTGMDLRTGKAERERPSEFFIEGEPVRDAATSQRPAAKAAATIPAQRTAPAKAGASTPAASPSSTSPPTSPAASPALCRPMSRKERKRQKGKR